MKHRNRTVNRIEGYESTKRADRSYMRTINKIRNNISRKQRESRFD